MNETIYPFSSKGIIQYDPHRPEKLSRGTAWWAVINCDREITRYMRYWVDKEIINKLGFDKGGLDLPCFDAHISIVRGQADIRHSATEKILRYWKKYDKQSVEFNYNINVHNTSDIPGYDRTNNYWFINIECPLIDIIRTELGLHTGYVPHLTIGKTW